MDPYLPRRALHRVHTSLLPCWAFSRSADGHGPHGGVPDPRVFAQLFNALASRSAVKSAFSGMFTNRWLWGAIALSIVLQLAVIYIPVLNTAFGTNAAPLAPAV